MFDQSDALYRLFAFPFVVSAGVSVLIILTQKHHGKFTHDNRSGVQKFHDVPTPRVGGLAMYVAFLTVWLFLENSVRQLLGFMLLAGIPAFTAGLLEDLTKEVSIGKRLLATMLSGVIACILFVYNLKTIGISAFDPLLAILPVSVAFTAFAVGGVANAVNIIDGFNGLASGVLIICFSIFGIMAMHVGDVELAMLCLLQVAVVLGFMVINYPFGKIFMGDGGAYLMGFMLAWTAVMLHVRNEQVSVWAPVVVCAYPIIETLFSMVRRYLKSISPGSADSEHLHSLIKLKLVRRYFSRLPQYLRNSLVAPFCWAFTLACALPAITFYQDTQKLVMVFSGGCILYGVLYKLLANLDDATVVTQKKLVRKDA
jgi:UDP-N-acetylmuramyl pentapeptide phosphotransferase/UDP-N-acetylglucosamine-1-phosphate transferase